MDTSEGRAFQLVVEESLPLPNVFFCSPQLAIFLHAACKYPKAFCALLSCYLPKHGCPLMMTHSYWPCYFSHSLNLHCMLFDASTMTYFSSLTSIFCLLQGVIQAAYLPLRQISLHHSGFDCKLFWSFLFQQEKY